MPINIFISYSRKDKVLRNKLTTHLANLRNQGIISEWHDGHIIPGTEWEPQILHHLNTDQIILLLISPDFMASDFCNRIELKQAIARHDAGQARVLPILLRPTDWEGAPFAKLGILPNDAVPVTKWPTHDEGFLDVVEGIKRAMKDLQASPTAMDHPQVRTHYLPLPRNPYFTGREEVLAQLHETLTRTKHAALTQPQAISGLGGIGKTQTALEYAYRYGDDYQYLFWLKASTREELAADLAAIATYLNLPQQEVQDQRIVLQAVTSWLETHPGWLLILDNADDLSLIRDYLPQHRQGHILLTTRAQSMSGLAQKIEIARMPPEEGTLFLLRRAGMLSHLSQHASLDTALATDRAIAQQLVSEMDSLPLALDQAGAYIEETQCGLSSFLTLYRTQRAKILKRRGGIASDHPPVAATWSLSFEKVKEANPAAADLLRLCAFLAPDAIPEELFTEGAEELGPSLQPVAADPFELNLAIGELLKYSLLQRDQETQTLSVHRLVQAVLTDEMDEQTRHLWAERSVKAVHCAFPNVDNPEEWSHCERFVPQAQVCVMLIEHHDFTFLEATELLNLVGNYLYKRAHYSNALPFYQQALVICEKACGPEHSDTALSLNNLATLYNAQGDYTTALLLYQRVLTINEKAFGPSHLFTAYNFNNLGLFYLNQGNYSEALPFLQHAIEIKETVLGPEHPDTALSLNNLALLYWNQGNYAEAAPLYQRVHSIFEKEFGPNHPDTATSLNNLALLYEDQGNYTEALPLYQRALAICEQVLGPQHPDTAGSLNNLALLYSSQGNYAEALPLLQRALNILEKLFPNHPNTVIVRKNYASLLREME